MFEHLHAAMKEHALAAHPAPACGAVFGAADAARYRPVEDAADPSRLGFRLDPDTPGLAPGGDGPLQAVVVSHPDPSGGERVDPLLLTPSEPQMITQEGFAVPFGVVPCTGTMALDPFWFGDQCPIPPLVGRPFRHGVTDCYAIIRDWYRLERNVVLPEFPRDWNWWTVEGGRDLYEHGFGKAGFRRATEEELGQGDVVLFRIKAKVPNHGAVLLNSGWMIHHPAYLTPYDPFRISRMEQLDRWRRFASHWLRYEGAPQGSARA